ncbi:MAG TPA: hypothetical protein VJ694_02810 [Patescibacteria group bacterium]|nr:hypothetical protein [Patescibacteria group bacterium]
MWRIFRWLDGQAPDIHKFTIMVAGLGSVVGVAFLLFLAHPAAGIVFGFGSVFALMKASMTYRFEKKPRPPVPESRLPLSEASDGEVLRRVRRSANTEKLRRHILWLAAHDRGTRGEMARGIVERWKAAGMPEGKPVEPKADDAN